MIGEEVEYTEVIGIIGGLGPKASSLLYDSLVETRVSLFQVMSKYRDDEEQRLVQVNKASTSPWTKYQIRTVLEHNEG